MNVERTTLLHALGALVAGGAERAAVDTLVAMRRAGWPVELAVLSNRRDAVGDGWAALLREEGVPIHTAPDVRLNIRNIRWFRRQLTRPDLALVYLHIPYAEALYFFTRFTHRRKYAAVRKLANAAWPANPRFYWPMKLSDVRWSVAGGEATDAFFRGRLKGEQVCIPNGRFFAWETQDPDRRDARLVALGLDPRKRHVITVGRMTGNTPESDQKAHDTLIRAWRQADLADAELHFMGEGRLRGELEAMADGCTSIRFEGVRTDVPAWLEAADLFAFPSRWEGLPNALIEAAATGIRLLLSDIPSNREVAGTYARYAPVDDVASWSEGLRSSLAASPPGKTFALEVRARYGVASRLPAFAEVFRRAMAGSGLPTDSTF